MKLRPLHDRVIIKRLEGETAPLITIGALTYVAFTPGSLFDPFTVLPIQIYNWISRPQPAFHQLAAGGIVIPDTATEKPIKGEVVAVGTGKILEDGKVRPLAVKAGDKVLFGKYSGTEVKVDGEELLVMREEDLMAIIES